jgi:ribose transport system substrate-binding protein
VKTDNVGGSAEAAKYMAAALKKKGWAGSEVAIIDVSLALANGRARLRGFKDGIEKEGFKVIAVLEAKDYTRAESMKFTQDILTAHPKVRGINAAFDEAILGTLTAVETMKKQKELVLASFDGSAESGQALKDGELGAIAAQQAVLMGKLGLGAAVDVLNGRTVKKQIDVPCFLVTAENVASSMKALNENVFTTGK